MKKLIAGLLLTGLITTNAIAADLKIGVVSVERILAESPQINALSASLAERFDPQREELKKAEKDITALQGNYKRNELVMTEDKLNELKKEIITKLQALKQKEGIIAQEITTVRNQEFAVLQRQVGGIIEDLAKSGKYSLILSEGVAYADDDLDVTDKVLDKMKAAFKKK